MSRFIQIFRPSPPKPPPPPPPPEPEPEPEKKKDLSKGRRAALISLKKTGARGVQEEANVGRKKILV
tara:strand:+ start:4121 stop:4321 length:201 start_codon:yes stop_codon:yes gene_type:complete